MRGLIWAARHPRPRLAGRVCYGRLDVPLAEAAERGAAALVAAAGDPVERIVSSPASRALLVARAVAALTGAPLHTDDRLQEMDFGTWEGQAWSAVPRAALDAWAADTVGYRPGGGETVAEMLRRLRRAWTNLASSADNTLLVTHAGPIRCLLHIASGIPLDEALAASIPFGGVVRLGRAKGPAAPA